MRDRDELFRLASNGSDAAYMFLSTLFKAADIADDIHDEPPENWRVAELFMLLTALPGNAFYQQHAPGLRSLIMSSVIAWDLSNRIEGPQYAVYIEQMISYVALLCGGRDLAKQVATAVATRDWGH